MSNRPPIVLLLSLCIVASSLFAESLYVQSNKARILSEPAFNAPILLTVEKGTELKLLESQKRWAKVQWGDSEGWVSTLLVKRDPPIEKISVIGSDEVTIEGTTRRRASEVATAGATRGLNDSEDISGDLFSDYEELNMMESLFIDSEIVFDFSADINMEIGN